MHLCAAAGRSRLVKGSGEVIEEIVSVGAPPQTMHAWEIPTISMRALGAVEISMHAWLSQYRHTQMRARAFGVRSDCLVWLVCSVSV